ncbi:MULTISPECIES: GNAT family N-acetyltransferase [Okeania]|uniref:N-acetyltransferase n=1 Tax=Okeania hirsuta TaxID=1458930 RepID=A0A3N6P649_9CYAN|nr:MULTISPECIES: GNAT family N-acetyltransferase [Okeania]NET15560.1 GNAT family N-acetyltransferase [Okeania sp. SIO1H6]NES78801.1 GNAT family N-acetyltransferase [Okeania sp. SIO1H4]NES91147.1 GNAT family N-acetyltransferase [Okeania sp. SIO2B9]NET22436.1 GNAT family N-acetyltransferase [Okeania sp. SIO1H5]NET79206.1 GNAT family N-acetyltransferase [Okeania sp. SIO1F9]
MAYLETQRLILRDFHQQYLYQLAPILANSKVMKFSHTGILSPLQTKEKIHSFINSYKKNRFEKWAVILKETNKLIGYCGIAIEEIDKVHEQEIGYRFAPEFWGNGLATEAALATIQYAFKQLKFPYILGIVERENIASVKVLEKLGMRYENQTIFHGIKMDIYRLNASP